MKLVIAEKPSVGKSIAAVIGAGENKREYMEGNGYIVSWCIGHLVNLIKADEYCEEWSGWTYDTLPIIPTEWRHSVKQETVKQYKTLKELMHRTDVSEVVNACDAGREGELIFRRVYYKADCKKPIKRLWISSMEEKAIKEGFKDLKDGSEYEDVYRSAMCRAKADWLVGINATRLFTVLYKSRRALNVGRVQSPTLAMIVDREDKIKNFVKEKFYRVHLVCDGIDAVSENIDFLNEAELVMNECNGHNAAVTTVKKEVKNVYPPQLYDLTTLQRDANRIYGYTAAQTLEYTQGLYEKKLVTYPRTDSRYLTEDMENTARTVIQTINKVFKYPENENPDIKRVMDNSKVSDHHAIIPTVEISTNMNISEDEKKILGLIANRVICSTGKKHTYESVKAGIECSGHIFITTGKTVTETGWKETEARIVTKTDKEEMPLPQLTEGQVFNNAESNISEHFTTPPKHFTEDTLLSAMERAGSDEVSDDVERKGIGTTATRSTIIESLVNNGFITREKKNVIPTDKGIRLISILPDILKSASLTAEWENNLTLVAKGEMEDEDFMSGIIEMVRSLVEDNRECDENKKNLFAGAESAEILGVCPNCGQNVVVGKYGAYCSGKCGMTFSHAFGHELTTAQISKLLIGKKVLLKGLKSKSGKNYDAYIVPDGTEPYSYIKDGREISGIQFKYKMEFPERKKK